MILEIYLSAHNLLKVQSCVNLLKSSLQGRDFEMALTKVSIALRPASKTNQCMRSVRSEG